MHSNVSVSANCDTRWRSHRHPHINKMLHGWSRQSVCASHPYAHGLIPGFPRTFIHDLDIATALVRGKWTDINRTHQII